MDRILFIFMSLILTNISYADDTEIYTSRGDDIPPNVVFIIDTSGSMAFSANGDRRPTKNEKSRLEILKSAATKVVADLDTKKPINLSIMRFDARHNSAYEGKDGSKGGWVLYPFTTIDSENSKKPLIHSINSLSLNNIGGGTPITETLFEAYRYIKGDAAVHGKPEFGTRAHPKKTMSTRFKGNTNELIYPIVNSTRIGSHADSLKLVNGHYYYQSPVTDTCQKNHIILFTDGYPSYDLMENATIKNLTSRMQLPADIPRNQCIPFNNRTVDPNQRGNGGCTALLSYWLQNTDHFVDAQISEHPSNQEIMQNIHVHTVGGFAGVSNSAKQYLSDIAKFGNPLNPNNIDSKTGYSKFFYNANNEVELANSLSLIFHNIAHTSGSSPSPSVAINSFNGLEHRDDIYYSLFQPTKYPGWTGNIKRYRMDSSGQIFDSKGNKAVDPQTGFLSQGAHSYWSREVDGLTVEKGGIASYLSANRHVYSNILAGSTIIQNGNRISENNTGITKQMLAAALPATYNFTETERANTLKWARGLDTNSTNINVPRQSLADPLHTTPILVTYNEGSTNQDVLFAGTNIGYIHAFNPNTQNPSELWAFMPKELLPNLAIYQTGRSQFLKAYGIDGPLTIYHVDSNKNRLIDRSEKAFLVAGMRRGGRHYYLLDISQRNSPQLAAQISPTSSGFEEIGQTWSRMMPAKVNFNGQTIPVFFFGGGYDAQEDNNTVRTRHTLGNAIYMVSADPATPFKLLWKASGQATNLYGPSLNKMTSSFAADVSLVDHDGDGTVDLLYAADVGGRIWRFDFNAANSGAHDFAKGDVIADFNDGTASGNIRFYTQPDVVYTEYGFIEERDTRRNRTTKHKKGRYQISIGSGFRASPLNTVVNDKFFIINDFAINGAPSQYRTLRIDDLANHNAYTSASISQRANGLYYPLTGSGEKVLSNSLTVNNVVYITTFRPARDGSSNDCKPDSGKARMIMLAPATSPTSSERSVQTLDLKQSGIPPKPVLLFPPTDPNQSESQAQPVIAVGMEIMPLALDFYAMERIYWRNIIQQH